MNRDSEEQRAVSQTLCGALQKEANCKCLVLSVLIYGCLAAVTWCRCANVTKVVINFQNYPLKRTEYVSPCDEGYIYIPIAFMGMLYLVYLVECYHSPIRIDLFHADSQDNVMTKLTQLKLAQPTIWWKAVSYHYVRRKRQITRYRNGDNYTTTQVYYERANTHAATSFYFYDYCGVKDISKDLTTDTKIPITKITLSKGFAFSNMRSATEFEEARSRFFAEQELRDDYMEMREGLDLGYNFNPTTIVGILGNPWFTNSYVYWCLSALLLSWPLRIIIEYNTQYADYQVTKLFGVNYDTPTSGEQIHESSSQLSAPGSLMLAPSYSEALLMEPSPILTNCQTMDESSSSSDAIITSNENVNTDIVPSYSEALLYERAHQQQCSIVAASSVVQERLNNCDCFCHYSSVDKSTLKTIEQDDNYDRPTTSVFANRDNGVSSCSRCEINNDNFTSGVNSNESNCRGNIHIGEKLNSMENSWSCFMMREQQQNPSSRLTRDLSAPNFSTFSETLLTSTNSQFLRPIGNSLENILENDELCDSSLESSSNFIEIDSRNDSRNNGIVKKTIGCGTIPKYKPPTMNSIGIDNNCTNSRYRLIENPMNEEEPETASSNNDDSESNIANSKTYSCLKSILKQHKRRYTLVTTEELKKFTILDDRHSETIPDKAMKNLRDDKRTLPLFTRDKILRRNRDTYPGQSTMMDQKIQRVSSTRSLIFPSPIEEACRTIPNDPFGGKAVHVLPVRNNEKPTDQDETIARFTKLARSLTSVQHKSLSIDSAQRVRTNRYRNTGEKHHRRNLSIEPEYLLHACRWSTKVDESVDAQSNNIEHEIQPGCSIEGERRTVNNSSVTMPVKLRNNLTRGLSLYDNKTNRNTRKKFLRTSLTETTGNTLSLSFNDETNRDESNLSSSKRFNLSMETSL